LGISFSKRKLSIGSEQPSSGHLNLSIAVPFSSSVYKCICKHSLSNL
jgi:hypothetical protein